MPKVLFLLSFIAAFVSGHAQWYQQPKPLHKKEFTKVASNQYTVAFEYEITETGNNLTRVVEYGAQGLPAALYEKGTNDNGDSIDIASTVYKFDGNGRLIREINTDKVEGAEWTNIYTYSKDGKLIKKQTVTIDPPTTVYSYDGAGRLIKTFTSQKMPATTDDGEPTGKSVDKPHEKQSFVYDKTGRLKEQLIYNLSYTEDAKKWNRKIQWTYNIGGQVSKQEIFDEDGKPYHTETFEYDKDGLLQKATVLSHDEPLKTFSYAYCTTCKQSWMK